MNRTTAVVVGMALLLTPAIAQTPNPEMDLCRQQLTNVHSAMDDMERRFVLSSREAAVQRQSLVDLQQWVAAYFAQPAPTQ